MSKRASVRASGKTAADETAAEEAEALDQRLGEGDDADIPLDRKPTFRHIGFTRMRTAWQGPEADTMRAAETAIEDTVFGIYQDAYQIMDELFTKVREPEVNPDGSIQVDRHGLTVWKRTEVGGYVEHWDQLTRNDRQHFLYLITTRLVGWRLRAEQAWTEAMMAKAIWEDAYAIGFDRPADATDSHRTERAKLEAKDHRYFGIFVTSISRRSEAICRSMELLGQRLRDTLDL